MPHVSGHATLFQVAWFARVSLKWLALLLTLASCRARTDSNATEESLGPPSLDSAMAGLPRDRAFPMRLVSDRGAIRCELDPRGAPHAVALFVGFATGRARFRDPRSGEIAARPLYRNLPFTRGVRSVLIQSGDPVGDGSGQPGYRIAVESAANDAERLSTPGALVLARYQAPPGRTDPNPPPRGHVLGSQFAVLLTDMRHLAGKVSVLGRCDDLDLAREIAERVADGEPHTLLRVELAQPTQAR